MDQPSHPLLFLGFARVPLVFERASRIARLPMPECLSPTWLLSTASTVRRLNIVIALSNLDTKQPQAQQDPIAIEPNGSSRGCGPASSATMLFLEKKRLQPHDVKTWSETVTGRNKDTTPPPLEGFSLLLGFPRGGSRGNPTLKNSGCASKDKFRREALVRLHFKNVCVRLHTTLPQQLFDKKTCQRTMRDPSISPSTQPTQQRSKHRSVLTEPDEAHPLARRLRASAPAGIRGVDTTLVRIQGQRCKSCKPS